MSERTAIVTGAGKRVGAAIARTLLHDGWTVIAHVHHAEDSVADEAIKVVADLADLDCADAIFEAAAGQPPVRLLVNNAARFAWDGFGEFDPGELDAHMAVNVRAPALLIERLAAAHRGGDALVVNLLDAKLAGPNPDYLSYTLSKTALAGLTELAARALAVAACLERCPRAIAWPRRAGARGGGFGGRRRGAFRQLRHVGHSLVAATQRRRAGDALP